MSNYPSVDQLATLQQLIADFAKITRVIQLADTNRAENDVEHSFGLALTAWFLHDKIAPNLDLSRVLTYALAHDIIEIHAGDTYVFDAEAVRSKAERESRALDRLRGEWPDFPALTDAAAAYADKRDEEARYVYAIDKLLPVIMVELGEKDSFWKSRGITLEMERQNKVTILTSDVVAPYYEMLLEWLDTQGTIPKD